MLPCSGSVLELLLYYTDRQQMRGSDGSCSEYPDSKATLGEDFSQLTLCAFEATHQRIATPGAPTACTQLCMR